MRPKDMSNKQIAALPVYTGEIAVPLTDEDRAAGMMGTMKSVKDPRKTQVFAYQPDDIIGWTDGNGQTYGFGQFADGEWFKRPV